MLPKLGLVFSSLSSCSPGDTSLPSGPVMTIWLGSHTYPNPPGPGHAFSTSTGQQRKPLSQLHPCLPLGVVCKHYPRHSRFNPSLLHSTGIISAHVWPLLSNDF